jgi:ABC-2 type transport system permease protein
MGLDSRAAHVSARAGLGRRRGKLHAVSMLIVMPLVFLGGSFYSINMLSPLWRKISLFNPVVYLVSGLHWCFYRVSDVSAH